MQTEYYLPPSDEEREVWLTTLQTGVAALPPTWNISVPQQLSLLNDTNAFRYSLVFLAAAVAFKETCTSSKNKFRNGASTSLPQAFPVFVPPAGAPTPVPPGIFQRVTLLVGLLKKNALYTETIGIALGIIGADIVVDFAKVKPRLELLLEGGFVHVKYVRGHTEGMYLYSLRGTETEFTLLATVTKPTYKDTRPNLLVGQAEKRQYRAFYMVGDVAVGLESAVAIINC